MPNYHWAWHRGGTYFFTVNLLERHGNDLLVPHIDALRAAVRITLFSGVICLLLQLTLIGWMPAAIWSVYILNQYQTDQKIEAALVAKSN